MLQVPVNELARERVVSVARTSMASKIVGADDEHFANMVADAVLAVKTEPEGDAEDSGKTLYPVKNIGVLLANGNSM